MESESMSIENDKIGFQNFRQIRRGIALRAAMAEFLTAISLSLCLVVALTVVTFSMLSMHG